MNEKLVKLAGLALLVAALGDSTWAAPVTFRVTGTVDFVSSQLSSVFSIGDSYELVYTFESTTPDSDGSASLGVYAAISSVRVAVGGYAASISSFNLNRISVRNNVSGLGDFYRIDLTGISGPPAAGIPLGNQTALFQLRDSSATAFSNDALPATALNLGNFDVGGGSFLALAFGSSPQALVSARVDSFELFVPDRPITFNVEGTVDFVSSQLSSAFSIGDAYDLTYTFESTTPDSSGSATEGIYDSILQVDVAVGSYAASISSFNINRITVRNNVSGLGDFYRIDLTGISGPPAAGIPLGNQTALFQLRDSTSTAFSNDALPTSALNLGNFDVGGGSFLALAFGSFPQALVSARVDRFTLVGPFDDVSPSHWAIAFITKLKLSGITRGCGNDNFCPDNAVNRAQMAVFLERAMRGSAYVPPPATGNTFLDVGANDFAAGFIEQLFLDGITSGCGGNRYCPNDAVTRAQMAVFLLRAKHGASYTPPAALGVFNDVDLSHWAGAWIERLYHEGITGGCGGGNYCPDAAATRAQMAVLLVRAFDL